MRSNECNTSHGLDIRNKPEGGNIYPTYYKNSIGSRNFNTTRQIFLIEPFSQDLPIDYEISRKMIEVVNIKSNKLAKGPLKGITRIQNDKLDEFIFTKYHYHQITPELILGKWNFGLNTIKNALRIATQLGLRSTIDSLNRRHRTYIL